MREVGAPIPRLAEPIQSLTCYGCAFSVKGFLSCLVLSWSLYGWHLGTWTLALREGKTLFLAECSEAYQITDGFPSSWGIGLCSGGKRDRIAQLVWTHWSFRILPLSQKRVWPLGIPPSRAGAQTRNALGARCIRLSKMALLIQNLTRAPGHVQPRERGLAVISQGVEVFPWGWLRKKASSPHLGVQSDFPSLDFMEIFLYHFRIDSISRCFHHLICSQIFAKFSCHRNLSS